MADEENKDLTELTSAQRAKQVAANTLSQDNASALAEMAVSMHPIGGLAVGAKDIYQGLTDKDMIQLAAGGMGMFPGVPGNLAKAVAKRVSAGLKKLRGAPVDDALGGLARKNLIGERNVELIEARAGKSVDDMEEAELAYHADRVLAENEPDMLVEEFQDLQAFVDDMGASPYTKPIFASKGVIPEFQEQLSSALERRGFDPDLKGMAGVKKYFELNPDGSVSAFVRTPDTFRIRYNKRTFKENTPVEEIENFLAQNADPVGDEVLTLKKKQDELFRRNTGRQAESKPVGKEPALSPEERLADKMAFRQQREFEFEEALEYGEFADESPAVQRALQKAARMDSSSLADLRKTNPELADAYDDAILYKDASGLSRLLD
tara:strand:+ start:19 stop:1152 length:1134 start_codon:yes stop_codon:yes gene_type:complete